jgi:hypothetical protein
MSTLGPVSAALEAEVRAAVRRHGLVIWLDPERNYTALVDILIARQAQGTLPYPVLGLRGSALALVLELADLAGGVDRPALLLHLPGLDAQSVRKTPLLELAAAGVHLHRPLAAVVSDAAAGRVPPAEIAAFLAGPVVDLPGADAWLARALRATAGGELEATVRGLPLTALIDDLLGRGVVQQRLGETGATAAVLAAVEASAGLPEAWVALSLPTDGRSAEDLAFALASWALAVEYVDDLRRPPHAACLPQQNRLPRAVIDACRALASHLRQRHAAMYLATADATEGWLVEEREQARAEDLGQIDTFRFEEDKVLDAALDALEAEDWATVQRWSAPRMEGGSFWLRDDLPRRGAWELIDGAARLGAAIAAAGPQLGAHDHNDAVDAYMARGARVDHAHRLLEQRRADLLLQPLPRVELLRRRLDGLREAWRTWANAWASDFNDLCVREGFLPPPRLQQRALFDEVVGPLTREPGTTALFLVDALRFEMAEALCQKLGDGGPTTALLRARLAELPTVTEVGMNVLAPVVRGGRLRPQVVEGAIKSFHSGEVGVRSREGRARVMGERAGAAGCPSLVLEELLAREAAGLRRTISGAKLVVVHSTELDTAGENELGLIAFEGLLQRLRTALRLLHEAGVRRFVLTADHGFLLLDPSAPQVQQHGRRAVGSRRHVIGPRVADRAGEVQVPLSALDYEDTDGLHLVLPRTTAVFETTGRPGGFVHGGNSLQERVIPVLTLVHRAPAGVDGHRYVARAEARGGFGDLHRLAGRVEVESTGMLPFGGSRVVELALRVVDLEGVTVEISQALGGAQLRGASIDATVSEDFELTFRLTGPVDRRVQVEVFHPTGSVELLPCVVEGRFGVRQTARKDEATAPSARKSPPAGTDHRWAEALEPGVREFFLHIEAHGLITEEEAAAMLGGARGLRRLSARFEEHAGRAPFAVRIEAGPAGKRYVRDGGR